VAVVVVVVVAVAVVGNSLTVKPSK